MVIAWYGQRDRPPIGIAALVIVLLPVQLLLGALAAWSSRSSSIGGPVSD